MIKKVRELKVKYIDTNMQFKCIGDDLEEVTLEIIDIDNHIHPVERLIRTMKEGIRSIIIDMPFLHIQIVIVKHIVTLITRNINQFPSKMKYLKNIAPL